MTCNLTEQANIDTIRRMFAAEKERDWDAVYAPFKAEGVGHLGSVDQHGLEEMRSSNPQIYAPFSAGERTVLDIVANESTKEE